MYSTESISLGLYRMDGTTYYNLLVEKLIWTYRKDVLYVGQREVVLHENTILFFFNPDPSNCSMHSFLVAMSCGLEEKY